MQPLFTLQLAPGPPGLAPVVLPLEPAQTELLGSQSPFWQSLFTRQSSPAPAAQNPPVATKPLSEPTANNECKSSLAEGRMATVRELRAYTAIGATYGTVVEHLVHDPVPVEQLVHRLP